MSQESSSSDTQLQQTETKRRPIKSFVIRSARMTVAQQKGWQDGWPSKGMELGSAGEDVRTQFDQTQPLIVEIGFGMGASLAEMANAAPDQNFLGIEVHRPGVGALLALAEEQEIKNLRVFCADANEVLKQHISNDSIHRLQLYFPDPWHKARHNKRRLVQPAFVQFIRPKLEIGGVFHMATDWEPYAQHMMEVMEAAEGYRNLSGKNQFAEQPSYRPSTKFEKRGQKLGHGVWDLLYERVS